MPAAICDKACEETNYDELIPIGYKDDDGKYYLYNHMDFHVILNQQANDTFQIVGFRIEPKSIHYNPEMVKVLNKEDTETINDWGTYNKALKYLPDRPKD